MSRNRVYSSLAVCLSLVGAGLLQEAQSQAYNYHSEYKLRPIVQAPKANGRGDGRLSWKDLQLAFRTSLGVLPEEFKPFRAELEAACDVTKDGRCSNADIVRLNNIIMGSGDVDADGIVSIHDVVLAHEIASGRTPSNLTADQDFIVSSCDTNRNWKCDQDDVEKLMSRIRGTGDVNGDGLRSWADVRIISEIIAKAPSARDSSVRHRAVSAACDIVPDIKIQVFPPRYVCNEADLKALMKVVHGSGKLSVAALPQSQCPSIEGASLVSLDPSIKVRQQSPLEIFSYGVNSDIRINSVGADARGAFMWLPFGTDFIRNLSQSEIQGIIKSVDSSCHYSFEGKSYEAFYPAKKSQLVGKTFELSYPGYTCRGMPGNPEENYPSHVDRITFSESGEELFVTTHGDRCNETRDPLTLVSAESYRISTDGQTLVTKRGAYRRKDR